MESVETLLKRHEDFENTLSAQDRAVQDLDGMANQLVQEQHPDSQA